MTVICQQNVCKFSSDLAGRGWGFSGREVSLNLQIALWSNTTGIWRMPRISLFRKKRKLALELGGLIKVNIHLGLKSLRGDQKQLTEVVICCVKREKQRVAASKLWLTAYVKCSHWSLRKFIQVNEGGILL